jgi:hypothetical protein
MLESHIVNSNEIKRIRYRKKSITTYRKEQRNLRLMMMIMNIPSYDK